jgi:hypothetical protein
MQPSGNAATQQYALRGLIPADKLVLLRYPMSHITLALMPTVSTLSSPNRIVWELFQALRRLCGRVQEAHDAQDESVLRQDAALCVILAVQCVEVFFNVYFRVLVSEPTYAHAAEKIVADMARAQCGLDKKIKEWPHIVFGQNLRLDKAAGQRFVALKNLRHKLVHFTSSHETFSIPGVAIHGLADTSVYESLSAKIALEALHTAEGILCEVFLLRGIAPAELSHALHSWTGRPPI